MQKEKDEASEAPGADRGGDRPDRARVRRPEEIWKAEKSAAAGLGPHQEEIDRLKAEIEGCKRKGKLEKGAELQYGRCPS